jgi:AcrR family transcriptional regulator
MPKDPGPARQSLIRAGERLFAERGIENVSLREINLAAGQRNSSALHYHFGSREKLLEEILAQHAGEVREVRLAMLKEIENGGPSDLRSVALTIVRPLALPLDQGPSGRAFCRILPQVLTDPERNPKDLAHLIGDTARERSFRLLEPYCSGLPKLVLLERLYLSQLQLVYAIAARATHLAALDGDSPPSSSAFFVSNLTDMFVGSLGAPVDRETLASMKQAVSSHGDPTLLASRRSRSRKKESQ